MPREEAERRRDFNPEVPPADRAKNRSLFFDDLLDAKLRVFNPRYDYKTSKFWEKTGRGFRFFNSDSLIDYNGKSRNTLKKFPILF